MNWRFTARVTLSITMVGARYYEQPNWLRMYECLLTNHLQGEAADLFLANS